MTTRTERRGSADALATRLLDVTLSLAVLLVLSPVMVVTALAIRFTSPGLALFRQERVDIDGRPFVMLKFRTMRPGTPDHLAREMIERELRGEDTSVDGSFKPPDGPHVTRVGALLRRTSLDELPQLFNVLQGDMALVGPRPCLRWEADMFPEFAAPRFTVKPGITGLWQVRGRSTLGTLDMLRLDVEYATTRSFLGDLRIVGGTVTTLVRGNGAR